MKKINNKGFIATSILFGIVALLFITFAIILGNSRASIRNDKIYGDLIKNEFSEPLGIKLFPNGGTVNPTNITVEYDKTYEGLPEPTRSGYRFVGWFTESEGGISVNDSTYYKDIMANKLYAHWNKNQYNLVIDPNEGTYEGSTSTKTLILDFEEAINISDPARVGYTFAGWELTGIGSKINDGVFEMGYEHATIKAIWQIGNIDLIVDPNKGTWEGQAVTQFFSMPYKSTKEIPDPVRDGYTFTGWIVEGKNSILSDKTFMIGEENAKLTANWQINTYPYIVKHYQETIAGNQYTLVDADTTTGEAIFGTQVTPPLNTYAGFTAFSEIKTITIYSDVSKNLVEYKYGRNFYKLTIDPNTGIYDGDVVLYLKYNGSTEIKTPTKKGYTFTNWTVSSGALNDKIYTISDSDAKLTANWEPNQYIVTFDANGGTNTITTKEVTYDSTYGDLPIPTRSGHRFLGWYTENDAGTQVLDTTKVEIVENQTLYAMWLPIDALYITYSNPAYTECTTLFCAFNELYEKYNQTK